MTISLTSTQDENIIHHPYIVNRTSCFTLSESSYHLGMNKLAAARAQILNLLCEGSSMRAVSRLTDTDVNTVAKLLIDAGKFCAGFHDAKVRNK